MNYYYIDANKSCWGGLKELIDRANEVIQMATEAGYPVWEYDKL